MSSSSDLHPTQITLADGTKVQVHEGGMWFADNPRAPGCPVCDRREPRQYLTPDTEVVLTSRRFTDGEHVYRETKLHWGGLEIWSLCSLERGNLVELRIEHYTKAAEAIVALTADPTRK